MPGERKREDCDDLENHQLFCRWDVPMRARKSSQGRGTMHMNSHPQWVHPSPSESDGGEMRWNANAMGRNAIAKYSHICTA